MKLDRLFKRGRSAKPNELIEEPDWPDAQVFVPFSTVNAQEESKKVHLELEECFLMTKDQISAQESPEPMTYHENRLQFRNVSSRSRSIRRARDAQMQSVSPERKRNLSPLTTDQTQSNVRILVPRL